MKSTRKAQKCQGSNASLTQTQAHQQCIEWINKSPDKCLHLYGMLTVGLCNPPDATPAEALAAQCEIPPPCWAIPFPDSIGYRTSSGIAQASLRYPFCGGGGGTAPPLCMLSKGETLRKGGTQLATLRHQKPHSTQ